MEEIGCIFCENKSDRTYSRKADNTLIEENGYQGKKCHQCGLVYVSPRPSADEIYDLYGHDDAQISATAHISSDYLKRLYARHNLNIISSFVKSGSLLEIGAGAGYFLDEARKLGFKPYGLEFNPIQANFIRNNLKLPCEEASLSTSIFEGQKFDIVYHCDVISHFFDPIAEFKTINKIMKDDAFLVFETGNFGDVDPKYFKHIRRFQYPDHLFFFSTENIIELLEKTDFELKAIYRYSIVPQLLFQKTVSQVRGSNTKSFSQQKIAEQFTVKNETKQTKETDLHSKNHKPFFKKMLSNAYKYFNYLVRYQIGAVAPKKHRPQTIVVVAQKKSSKH